MVNTLRHHKSHFTSGLSVTDCALEAFRWTCKQKDGAAHMNEDLLQIALSKIDDARLSWYDRSQESCCKALAYLSRDARWAIWLSERSASEKLVGFMDRSLESTARCAIHREKHPEYTASTLALTQLLEREPLQVDGAPRVVLGAMSSVPKEVKMQVRGCAFLASLHWSPLNAIKATAFCACETVLNAMFLRKLCRSRAASRC